MMPGAGALYMGYGNRVISEADAAGAVKREYVWLGDLIVGVVDGAAVYSVENDHLGRPIRMRDAARADVWRAKYRPFGQALITGPATLDARFPGQWFQLETGLACKEAVMCGHRCAAIPVLFDPHPFGSSGFRPDRPPPGRAFHVPPDFD